VVLDFPKNKMRLRPKTDTEAAASMAELPAQLERNWWLVTISIGKKPALMLLDSGAAQTLVSDNWLAINHPGRLAKSRQQIARPGLPMETGNLDFESAGIPPIRVSVLHGPAGTIPMLEGSRSLNGLLGYDVLRHLTLELDYHSKKIHLIRPYSAH
jgi:hypothetical protein